MWAGETIIRDNCLRAYSAVGSAFEPGKARFIYSCRGAGYGIRSRSRTAIQAILLSTTKDSRASNHAYQGNNTNVVYFHELFYFVCVLFVSAGYFL